MVLPANPKALVIGWPVTHARSPLIHGFWLKEMGISGAYDRAAVEPGQVGAFLRGLPARGYRGGNVTVPHKEEAFAACDHVTPAAAAARAVNTFWFEDGALFGDNTDGAGFVAHLAQTHSDWAKTPPRALVLGAGGAARGIISALVTAAPAIVTLTNRSRARAETLRSDLIAAHPEAQIHIADWDDREAALGTSDLVINTTTLGMKGQPALDLDLSGLPAHAIVADIVYVPLETPLLAAAAARGLRRLDGLGMLLHQAVPGFVRWFGTCPVVSADLRDHILADLEPRTGPAT